MSLLETEEPDKKPRVIIEDAAEEMTPDRLKEIKSSTNYYELLGVAEDSKDDEISAAYKARALKLHPDKHTGSPHLELYKAAFETLSEAKRTLLDPQKRQQYDIRRGSTKVKDRWSFEALKERRQQMKADYKKIDYEVHLEAQLERAQMYQEMHEADKIAVFGHVLRQFRSEVLAEMREKGLSAEQAAQSASQKIGKPVDPAEIEQWAEMEAAGTGFEDGLSRKDLEKGCGLIDAKGRFKGYKSFEQLQTVFARDGDHLAGQPDTEVVSGASEKLRATILAHREAQRRKRQEEEDKERQAKLEEAAAKKRKREEEDAAFAAKVSKGAEGADATDGFLRVDEALSKSPSPSPPPSGVAALLQSLRPTPPPPEPPQPQETPVSGFFSLGGYDSE